MSWVFSAAVSEASSATFPEREPDRHASDPERIAGADVSAARERDVLSEWEGEEIDPVIELAEGFEHVAERDRRAPILIKGLGCDDENTPAGKAGHLGDAVAGRVVADRGEGLRSQLHKLLKLKFSSVLHGRFCSRSEGGSRCRQAHRWQGICPTLLGPSHTLE